MTNSPFDVVEKRENVPDVDTQRYNVVYHGKIRKGTDPKELITQAIKLFDKNVEEIKTLLKKNEAFLNEDLDKEDAEFNRSLWAKIGVICYIAPMIEKKTVYELVSKTKTCPACGYEEEEGEIDDICQECGVIKSKYIENKDKLKEEAELRERILRKQKIIEEQNAKEENDQAIKEAREQALERELLRQKGFVNQLKWYWEDLSSRSRMLHISFTLTIVGVLSLIIAGSFDVFSPDVVVPDIKEYKMAKYKLMSDKEETKERDINFSNAAKELAQSQQFGKASKVASFIKDKAIRLDTNGSMAESYHEMGDSVNSNHIMTESMAEVESYQSTYQQVSGLINVAQHQQNMGNKKSVKKVMKKVLTLANTSTNYTNKSRMLTNIAVSQMKMGSPVKAEETIGQALVSSYQIDDDAKRLKLLSHIGLQQTKLGNIKDAKQIFADVRDELAEMTDDVLKDEILMELAENQTQAKMFDEAMETAHLIINKNNKDKMFSFIASQYAENKQFNPANDVVKNITQPELIAQTYANIGQQQSTNSLKKEGLESFQKAVKESLKVKDRTQRISVLSNLGLKQAKSGYEDDSVKVFEKAKFFAELEKESEIKDKSYSLIAIKQAKARQFKASKKTVNKIESDELSETLNKEISVYQNELNNLKFWGVLE